MIGVQGELDNEQAERLRRIHTNWNFYEGYHWEELPEQDTPEITINYCRPFVNKFVAFELGRGFTITAKNDSDNMVVTDDGRTLVSYLTDVWNDNNMDILVNDIGQMKSVTGESWVQVRYFSADELDDPYGEYPEGRVRLLLMPSSTVFAEYDPHDRDKLVTLTIMYSYQRTVTTPILGRVKEETILYKQVWTKDMCTVIDGNAEPVQFPNKYGVIPFVQIKNLGLAGRTECISDLDDIIPLNVEYNMKKSDVSEIIDYHAAPVTIVYGAKIGNLEKGANKMWGGLSKDARVENLELSGDLSVSDNYTDDLKLSMCEVSGIPQTCLGGSQAISNTSGVALQYINLPLIEKTRTKRNNSKVGFEQVNKLILLVSLSEGLIFKPEEVTTKDFFYNEVTIPDTLPKDMLLELQQIEQEMKMGLEYRENALRRLGKDNTEELIAKIDADREENPTIYGIGGRGFDQQNEPQLNSGIMNGETSIEQVRKEVTGQNGGVTE